MILIPFTNEKGIRIAFLQIHDPDSPEVATYTPDNISELKQNGEDTTLAIIESIASFLSKNFDIKPEEPDAKSSGNALTDITWRDVSSSNVKAITWVSNTLFVRFKTNAVYAYLGVNYNTYAAMRDSDSVGRFLNDHIKPYHKYIEVKS